MKRTGNILFYHYLYEMGWLETMEFIFNDDIFIKYRDDNIAIYDKNHTHTIQLHGVAGKC